MALDEHDKIAHLLRRAGFAARPEDIDAGEAQGLQATAEQLLNFETIPDNLAPPPPGLDSNVDRGPAADYLMNLKGWWLNAMIKTNRPLQEKMVLFWHHLFATSVEGVGDSRQMYLQNQLFRGYFNPLLPLDRRTPEDTISPFPVGNFRNILMWLTRDPAMLYWLDNRLNSLKSGEVGTNENYARELMELFSLGVKDVVAKAPNYTEQDVRQTSRVLTGWSLLPANPENPQSVDGQPNNFARWFAFFPPSGRGTRHDPGPYRVLNVDFRSSDTNPADGRRLFDIIVQHKNQGEPQSACGRFLGYRLFKFFGYDDPEPEIINALADEFDNGTPRYNIKNMLRKIFMPGDLVSEAFYSEKAFKAHIKSPTEFVVSTYRLLRHPDGISLTPTIGNPPVSGPLLVLVGRKDRPGSVRERPGAMDQMGQSLFAPFDVSGWKEGINWINTTFDMARFNWASAFIAGTQIEQQRISSEVTTEWLRNVLTQNGAQKPEQIVDYFLSLLFQVPISDETKATLINYLLMRDDGTPGAFDFGQQTIDKKVRGLIYVMMSSPEFQFS
ncbi:MAG: DUF1800 domain-containing protein [Acidobacteria bacterium]|nr:DUF1800 domain-containing protein [Acidobacteriota bacterium]